MEITGNPQLDKIPGITCRAGTDYPYRIVVSRDKGEALLGLMVQNIAYDNFKDAARKADPTDAPYHDFLARTWSAGTCMEQGPRPGRLPKIGAPYPAPRLVGRVKDSAFAEVRRAAKSKPNLREQVLGRGKRKSKRKVGK